MPFLKHFSAIIFILFFLNLPGYAQVKKESVLTKKYSPQQLKQDAELMKKFGFNSVLKKPLGKTGFEAMLKSVSK